ncbi:MAG: aminotransferase class I/II-fold pyridoxal phosphate-dependent enzyme, partial [Balneolaceae bacterium]|nr:aminotransferase class I/II-fold pyridoxal phosphate-dependent enzyme [Balneolaceae bacterium]
ERTAASLSKSVITTRSLTKAYGLDDIRVGWIIAEAELAERLQRLADLFMPTMAFPSERLALEALKRADAMLEEGLELLNTNFQLVEACIDNHPELSWHPPETGTVSFVKVENISVEQLVEHLEEEYDTLVVPGHFFGMPDYFRIGWGMDTDDLSEGLINLVQALEDLEE